MEEQNSLIFQEDSVAADSASSPMVDAAVNSKDEDYPPGLLVLTSDANKRSLSELARETKSSSKKQRQFPRAIPLATVESKTLSFPYSTALPAATVDKDSWQGFCDIESEPAYFSVILRDMGVQGITVREVFAMDPALLETLPQPIHGLILLFHYRKFAKEDKVSVCPSKVWFANQLPAQSSCATLAMINILMNSVSVDIGEHLAQFKDFTRDFTPYQRGEALASFDFVKKIHNSFAKKMDILEADKHLSYKVKKALRSKHETMDTKRPRKGDGKKSRPRRPSVDSTATNDSAQEYEENAHHYIAFVPIGSEVWKLDGLDAQPISMGTFDATKNETWLSAVSNIIAALMATGDDDYGVIALTESPLLSLRTIACSAMSDISRIEARLSTLDATWPSFLTSDMDTPPMPSCLGLRPEDLTKGAAQTLVTDAQLDAELLPALLDRRAQAVTKLNNLANKIMMEIQAEVEEDQKAAQRRYDAGPVIQKWLEMLAENGHLEENVERFMPAAQGARRGKAKRKANRR